MSVTSFLLLLLLSASTCVVAHGGGSNGDASVPATDPRNKSLVLVKVWCLLIVFVVTFAAGVSPYFLKWNEGFLLLGTQFAGGVFLGTAMMHFLSDSAETFRDLTEKDYPFAFTLACSGYLMTSLADCAAGIVVGDRGFVEGNGNDASFVGAGVSQKSKSSSNDVYSQSDAQAEGATHAYMAKAAALLGSAAFGESMLLIVALCFHSIFEGIAIGVAGSKADAWKALWTVTLHKLFAAVAMSVTLLRTIPRRPFLSCAAYAFAFAVSSPIGVAIGIVIDATTRGRVADWIFAISMGVACGVFLFVSTHHLLSKGYRPQQPIAADSPFFRWLSVVTGVALIAVVVIWD